MESTIIQISYKLKEELNKMKVFSRETYEEIIWNIIEDRKELSNKTKQEIELSRKEIEEGNYITLAELKEKYNIK